MGSDYIRTAVFFVSINMTNPRIAEITKLIVLLLGNKYISISPHIPLQNNTTAKAIVTIFILCLVNDSFFMFSLGLGSIKVLGTFK